MGKLNPNYSYNGTDTTNDIYSAMAGNSMLFFSANGNEKICAEIGISQSYNGATFAFWKTASWRGGALAIGRNGLPVMIGQNNGENSIQWNPIVLKSDLVAPGFILNPDTCTVPFSVVNGWHSDVTNIPEAAKNKYATLLTMWIYGAASAGNLTASRMQTLIVEQGGGIFTRKYENSAWTNWA